MARNTQLHAKLPWTGGLNTAVDPGVIPDNDLVTANNVVFTTSGARLKREGFDYFDASIPTILGKSSSGTTRTLVFNAEVQSSLNDILVVGEKIVIAGDADYTGNYAVATTTTTTPAVKNFVDGDVTVGTENINITTHGYYTGLQAELTTTGTLPGGLALVTVYYVIVVDADNIKLATTEALALAGTAIDITTAAGGGTHTVTPNVATSNSITYTASTSVTESLTDAAGVTIAKDYSIIGIKDYWYISSNTKTQEIIAVSDEPKIYTFDINGNRKEISKDSTGTALTAPSKVNFLVSSNTLIMSFDAIGNTPKKYAPITNAAWFDLGGTPPDFEVAQLHLGRIFANDKTDKDRLHYSPPNSIETWNGSKDSGAIDIFPGDGDAKGIISIAAPFKGRFFVSKANKIIDLRGDAPENFRPVIVTEGLGMLNHAAIIPVDVDDLAFVSSRGFHSLVATDTQGSFSGTFLSKAIQPTFNDFVNARIDYMQGAYLPDINSLAFTASEDGSAFNNSLYLFNIEANAWYKWTGVNPQSIEILQKNSREKTFLMGDNAGRLVIANNGSYTDFETNGPAYLLKTGRIYPSNNPQSMKLFKKLTLFFKPSADFEFTVTYKVDNYEDTVLTFQTSPLIDTLGVGFVLGSSVLGSKSILSPYSRQIEGIGRGISIEVSSSATASPIEIYGYSIEWEPADLNQEVISGE